MERWSDKVALITGANSGIGKCLVECLVGRGMKVVGIARHVDKIKALADELKSMPGKLFPLQCDLSNQNDILRVLEWIEKNLGAVDILINNAAINIDITLQTGIDNGVIVNINDVCGLKVPISCDRPVSPAYISSKFALTALTECLRSELAQLESNIKVISISPGLVETNMTAQWLKENPHLALKPKDVSDCILFALQTPDTVLIKELVVTPIREMM
ncbi:Dehydrogenase/reductase SDR family member 11 [Anthophora plagiata]